MTKERTRTATQVRTEALTALEEKVVRMRHGFRAPATLELGTQDHGNADVAAQLAAIERRALEHGTKGNAKSRIVSALRQKNQ